MAWAGPSGSCRQWSGGGPAAQIAMAPIRSDLKWGNGLPRGATWGRMQVKALNVRDPGARIEMPKIE
jgi:hypothetical protein